MPCRATWALGHNAMGHGARRGRRHPARASGMRWRGWRARGMVARSRLPSTGGARAFATRQCSPRVGRAARRAADDVLCMGVSSRLCVCAWRAVRLATAAPAGRARPRKRYNDRGSRRRTAIRWRWRPGGMNLRVLRPAHGHAMTHTSPCTSQLTCHFLSTYIQYRLLPNLSPGLGLAKEKCSAEPKPLVDILLYDYSQLLFE